MLLLLSIGGLPLGLLLVVVTGELDALLVYPGWADPVFWLVLFLTVTMGVIISFAISLCATTNSPLATAITGNVKDIAGTLIGWALFGGFVATVNSVTGLAVSFVGAALYSYVKLRGSLQAATGSTAATAPALVQIRTA